MPNGTKTISIGPIAAASTTNIATAQSATANTPLTINGSAATAGVATLDVARRVLLTFAADETGHNFTLTGTDRYGRPQTEVIAGAAASAASVKDYVTITKIVPGSNGAGNISAGTNGVASSDAYICDWIANPNTIGAAVEAVGTVNVTVQECYDDFAPAWDQAANTFVWFNDPNFASVTQNKSGTLAGPFTAIRLTLNSGGTGTASAALKLIVPFIAGRI